MGVSPWYKVQCKSKPRSGDILIDLIYNLSKVNHRDAEGTENYFVWDENRLQRSQMSVARILCNEK